MKYKTFIITIISFIFCLFFLTVAGAFYCNIYHPLELFYIKESIILTFFCPSFVEGEVNRYIFVIFKWFFNFSYLDDVTVYLWILELTKTEQSCVDLIEVLSAIIFIEYPSVHLKVIELLQDDNLDLNKFMAIRYIFLFIMQSKFPLFGHEHQLTTI